MRRTLLCRSLLPFLAMAFSIASITDGKGGKPAAAKPKGKAAEPPVDPEEDPEDPEDPDVPPVDPEEEEEEAEGEEEETPAADKKAHQGRLSRALKVGFGKSDPLAAENSRLTGELAAANKKLAAANKKLANANTLLQAAGQQYDALTTVLGETLGVSADSITPASLKTALQGKITKETARSISATGTPARSLPQTNADESAGDFPAEGTFEERAAWIAKNPAKAKELARPKRK